MKKEVMTVQKYEVWIVTENDNDITLDEMEEALDSLMDCAYSVKRAYIQHSVAKPANREEMLKFMSSLGREEKRKKRKA